MNRGPLSSPVPSSNSRPNSRQPNDTALGPRWLRPFRDSGRTLAAFWAITAAALTGLDLGLARSVERQVQTLFFEVRGPVAPSKDVVILAIDEESLGQGEFFRADPQRYSSLAPIEAWPWQRAAYATVIDKLMAAGADAIALDIIFSTPSSYGEIDDQTFENALKRHQGQIILAAQYSQADVLQGYTTELTTPLPRFCDRPNCIGSINFLLDADGRIHQLGERYWQQLNIDSPELQTGVLPQLPTLATSVLQAAHRRTLPQSGNFIFFHGPSQTFEHIPFWYVLDPATWNGYLQSGAYFKDKIVLIGSTAAVHQDFHPVPFAKSWLYPQAMPGVEIHANAIATLMEGKALTDLFGESGWRGLFVLVGAGGAAWWLSRHPQPLRRLAWAAALAVAWTGISYSLFLGGRLIVPTAMPAGAIVLGGLSQLIVGSVKEQKRKRQLRDTLRQYVTSPIVQEIISQQDDLQDLLRERELALSGTVLAGRYRIVRVLGSGGFSETYVAEDRQRPGNPLCVVKQLRMLGAHENTLRLARRLFATEAETLERLGLHDQIPQLLASFEENEEFYLVQEFIQGHPLSQELLPRRQLSQPQVVRLMMELLEILSFVHSQGVIHRDLKPSNIMRRHKDGKLVLIDFGVAKKITTQLAESDEASRFTVSVGTPGYMPAEQSAGRPHFNSDIYALGMIGIEALTGQAPHTLNHSLKSGTVSWQHHVSNMSPELAVIVDLMVHPDAAVRYQSTQIVQAALLPFYQPDVLDLPPSEEEDDNLFFISSDTLIPDESEEGFEDTTVISPDDWAHR
ncbi:MULTISPECIES: serine/threonine-protein kinase [unclassified Leptolyngbya]|uniref:serine/threonine-protein kinase n=1 Tax=unclassified Leptolyngbya TaxID=2650499 RepID=UPI0016855860|nr:MULTISPECIES: serine/threonine-protein kinase [unclassified Leptolyngbya]MBD1909429.1 CHASE2 domain-containing protein [Leptolyngbya sp. FACHB-8]MBD2155674.1 CHASE2 domain-containing protein [Leptolyngbya sp. FACHB-16]